MFSAVRPLRHAACTWTFASRRGSAVTDYESLASQIMGKQPGAR